MYQPAPAGVSSPTGIAVLGCGYWGINYVRVFTELPDARVAVVCDQREARLDDVARRFPDLALTTDIDEAISTPGEDVGFVSLHYPNGTLAHIHVSWADPHKVREFVVVGSDKRVAFNDLDLIDR